MLWRSISLGLFVLRAAIEENAYNRMKKVVKWYISGFYKKPKVRSISMCNALHFAVWHSVFMHFSDYITVKSYVMLFFIPQGLKKPYNPIIGETYRCMWLHQKTNSKTFYIAEQVKQLLLENVSLMRLIYGRLSLVWRISNQQNKMSLYFVLADYICMCFSPGIPSSSSVSLLCQQSERRILPQWQHSCQIQVLWYTPPLTAKTSVLKKSVLIFIQLWVYDSSAGLEHLSTDCLCLNSRKLPVSHIRWRGSAHFSQPRRGLCDEHALRSL